MAIVFLGLGSNLGDRVGFVQQATSLLTNEEILNWLVHLLFMKRNLGILKLKIGL